MNINLSLGVISIFWLLSLSGFVFWFFLRIKNLLKDSKDGDFIKTIKTIEEIQNLNTKDLKAVKTEVSKLTDDALKHIQKVGLVKFNPFNESGGDHSFSLVLLDGNKNGIIITSLHTRERTRLYTKIVKAGKGLVELSEEESKALTQALK